MGARAYKYKLGIRSGKYKFGARAGKYKEGARAGKYKFGPGPVNTNWRPGPGARARSQGQGRGPSKEPGAGKYKHSTLTLKQICWKTKTCLKKLEYHFLIESTKIKKASFPYKTAISESDVKTNRMVQNGPITKNGVLPVTTLFFRKFCFSLRISYK